MKTSLTMAVGACLAGTLWATPAGNNEGEEEGSDLLARLTATESGEGGMIEESESSESILGSLKTIYQDSDKEITWGGRIFFDAGWFHDQSDYPTDSDSGAATAGNGDDGMEFRSARLFAKGKLYDTVEFKADYDFAGGDADFKDVYLGWKSPYGKLLVGHYKEPVSLEALGSSRFITFMERAMVIEALVPGRNDGIMASDMVGEKLNWAIGWFREADDFGDGSGDGDYSTTVRLAGPVWMEDEQNLVHVGGSFRYSNSMDTRIRYRPEAHLLDRVFDTTSMSDDGSILVGGEAAWVMGPLSVQGEYLYKDIDEFDAGDDVSFSGFYVFASYFLTGESRTYKVNGAKFDRIKPMENWDGKGLGGAWELAARFSYMDTDDESFSTKTKGVTGGLNWYLNPNTRIMLNGIWNNVDADNQGFGSIDDDMYAFMMRFQVDF